MEKQRVGAVTFKGKPLTVIGATVKMGSQAQDVTMRSGPLSTFRLLGDTAGKIRLISVVPCIETGVCETQTLRVNKEASGLDDRVVALTISSDLNPDYERAFSVVRSLLANEQSASHSTNRVPEASQHSEPKLDLSAVTIRIAPSSFFDWVKIPAGPFILGSDPKTDQHAWDDDQPQQTLDLQEFEIARIPVTNSQYRAFIEATGYRPPPHWIGGRIPAGKEEHPVVEVTWYDALNFCSWAGVRLPTEAEWEKAARGTDGRIYPWGNNKPNAHLGNFSFSIGETTPVGSYPAGASPYGLLDLAGNVWEWTTSKEWPYPYHATDGREELDGNERRILRGAAFRTVNPPRCAFRGGGTPPHYRSNYDGFRVARNVDVV